jgi:hypothetical protein
LSTAGKGIRKSTVMVVDKPYERKNTKGLSIEEQDTFLGSIRDGGSRA